MILMPKVNANGIQIYYKTRGKGFPLVMINGISNHLDCWDPRLIEALSRRFRLVLFDNRDSGRTDASKIEYHMETLADDTAGLMNALGIEKAHIMGISMGGMVAQELALKYPRKVSKLVLCSTGNKWCFSNEVSEIMLAVGESSREELTGMILSLKAAANFPEDYLKKHPFAAIVYTANFVKEHPDLVAFLSKQSAKHPRPIECWRRQLKAMREFNTEERLHQISAPTIVLHGKMDIEIPPENGSILAKVIPNAKLVCLEKSAHYLLEEMGDVIEILLGYLDKASDLAFNK
jgi:pimeloyl-ACP methyl ester carboxylesterase